MCWRPSLQQEVAHEFRKLANEGLETIRSLIPELKKLAENVNKSLAQDYSLDELIGRSDAQTH